MSDPSGRTFDIVLFGVTGFTGKLAAEYLARRYGAEIAWAIAGRNREKLEEIKRHLMRLVPTLGPLDVLVADCDDAASVDAVARQTRVVCTTVGPYVQHGRELASACAAHGTHYCDLAGEVPFLRESIDRNHARAIETGARIVHCCGFDSIPSDLGVWMVSEHLRERGHALATASFYCGPMRGGLSGGTLASMANLLEAAGRDAALRRLMADPYALLPDREIDRGPDGGDPREVSFDRRIGEWTGPFVMAAINTRVVRRSNALLGWPYGRSFRYREVMSFGDGPRGLGRAAAMTAGLGVFAATMMTPGGRRLASRVLPAPGQGPSKAQRDGGFFRVRILADSAPPEGEAPLEVLGVVEGTSDPGYGETAKMLGESAVCLAKDVERDGRAGVLTPASAMGTRLIERLRAAGMTFRVDPR
jgi:short subunit dehydrogenase-like uncharacterized protein